MSTTFSDPISKTASIFRHYQWYIFIICGLISVPAVMGLFFWGGGGRMGRNLCPRAALYCEFILGLEITVSLSPVHALEHLPMTLHHSETEVGEFKRLLRTHLFRVGETASHYWLRLYKFTYFLTYLLVLPYYGVHTAILSHSSILILFSTTWPASN